MQFDKLYPMCLIALENSSSNVLYKMYLHCTEDALSIFHTGNHGTVLSHSRVNCINTPHIFAVVEE